ncbi:hypothetical protein BDV38DRAFT_245953 [Aspergillus pseudotamarii]|uniref:Uncharacterized protein n=1 Tax=Aspergillus pseudotamarii TaxID=132259 RepID=A0A5N6SVU8_ASPPS|nr:uncharacterized protein BDV38DRAFT_245953 [Aspergillus pseudotamarii]KAE8137949.1 hypothetical protein BDV38DRAFT_245953 [Aspergillus pseudotamarii]
MPKVRFPFSGCSYTANPIYVACTLGGTDLYVINLRNVQNIARAIRRNGTQLAKLLRVKMVGEGRTP